MTLTVSVSGSMITVLYVCPQIRIVTLLETSVSRQMQCFNASTDSSVDPDGTSARVNSSDFVPKTGKATFLDPRSYT